MKKILLLIVTICFSYAIQAQTSTNSDTIVVNDTVYTMPQFPGGNKAWQKFLTKNLNTRIAKKHGAKPKRDEVLTYTVTVEFLVLDNGNVDQIKVTEVLPADTHEDLKAEAIRVIQKSPRWKPGTMNGQNAAIKQFQNIVFAVKNGF